MDKCDLRHTIAPHFVATDHDIAKRILDAVTTAARAPPTADSTVAYEPAFA